VRVVSRPRRRRRSICSSSVRQASSAQHGTLRPVSNRSARYDAEATRRAPPKPPQKRTRSDRVLPWIAAERTLRAIVLFLVGIALIANPDHNWGKSVADFARDLGLNPNSNGIEKIIHKLHAISSDRYAVYGIIALAYGALEAAEAYGLWRRRRWGEYLTVLATSLLFIPEIWEMANSASPLKAGALLLNIAVVAYLIFRLRSGRTSGPHAAAAAQGLMPSRVDIR
jgi:uncharacterized membrane protein (DUF2068 family)